MRVLMLLVLLLASTDWATVIKPASKQVPRLEVQKDGDDEPGVCSGVVLNTDPGYALTAAHCIPTGDKHTYSMTLNGRHAESVKVNRLLDLAVVRFDRKREDAMALAPETPPAGTEVAVVGYAFGVADLAVQFGRVSQSKNSETKLLLLNTDIIFGDSGGAVIDEQGRLVGMSSRIYSNGPAHLGGALRVEDIRDFVEKFLPTTK